MSNPSPPLTWSHPTFKGLTLLEMLVVLIITSFLTALLLQGFGLILQLRTQVSTHLHDLQHGALQEYWFRNSTTSLLSDYHNGKFIFQGNSQKFSGLTLFPLENSLGKIAPFAWQFERHEQETVLRYQKADGEYWTISRWPGQRGSFQYQDAQGQWHDQWPPAFFKTTPPQLPQAILCLAQRRQTPITWLVSIPSYHGARYDLREEGW